MSVVSESSRLDGTALEAWRSYLQSHAGIVRELDADLIAQHGITVRDYEVLLYLAQAEQRKLPMSALSERTMLTRSGITRLIDGLVGQGLIERVSCASDARVSYARLTDTGYDEAPQTLRLHARGRHPAPVPRELLGRRARSARQPAEPPARGSPGRCLHRRRRRICRRYRRILQRLLTVPGDEAAASPPSKQRRARRRSSGESAVEAAARRRHPTTYLTGQPFVVC